MPEKKYSKPFEDMFEEEIKKDLENFKKPAILVMGGTGTGKSTLVNLVFGREVAKAGVVKPVTKGINTYDDPRVTVYDSEGYETGEEEQKRYNELINSFLDENRQADDTRVHMVWYCLSLPAARFTGLDLKMLKSIKAREIPVAVILTKVDSATEEKSRLMISQIKEDCKEDCPDLEIFETTTNEKLLKELGSVEKIINWSYERLPEERRLAFIASCRAGIAKKKERGAACVKQHSALAAGIGAAPIPFSDAAMLVPNQAAMLARLNNIWNLEHLSKLPLESIGTLLTTSFGRYVAAFAVANVLKFFPGLGTVLGGLINGAVATALTLALGQVVNSQCAGYAEKILAGEKVNFGEFFDFKLLAPLLEEIAKKYNPEI